ncbi:transposase [Streptomyces albidoflavus]|nr:transposase [Streptomyces albidoflavus]
MRYRRAMMLPAYAGGNRVPVIAQLVQADEDTMREVIHRFNEIGLACLDPRWAGGRPRLLKPDDEDFVVATATTHPPSPVSPWPVGRSANPPPTCAASRDVPGAALCTTKSPRSSGPGWRTAGRRRPPRRPVP